MSFTLTYNKNGVPTPIKMSIWDALKGAPPSKPPKPKPVSVAEVMQPAMLVPTGAIASKHDTSQAVDHCSCCHKFHTISKSPGHNQGKKGDKSENKKDKKGGKDASSDDNKQDKNFSTREQETYTEADNETIIKLKQSNTQWKEILTAINKESESQLKAHWKKINPANQDKTDEASDKKKGNGKDDMDAKKKAEIEKKKAEGQAKKKQREDAKKKDSDATSKKGSKDKQAESGELKSWSDRYDKQKWVAAASRHFDLTGERITPAVAKKLAEEG